MIGFLRGSVLDVESNLVLIEVQGVGYEVVVADSVIPKVIPGQDCSLFIRQIFREDGVTLCGFLTKTDRLVFDMLLEVKGCGPKVAQALIGQVGTEAITRSILAGDTKTLSSATGVGPRLAERIIVELRPKVEGGKGVITGLPAVVVVNGDRDLIDALSALGYRRQEIDQVSTNIDKKLPIDEKLRLALQQLKKG